MEQALYTNRKIASAIDVILETSESPPVIIVQGDHGALALGGDDRGDRVLRMSILNAFLVPHSWKSQLYDGISPVNTFRIILNGLFDSGYPRLEDKAYFSKAENIARFEDVTELFKRSQVPE